MTKRRRRELEKTIRAAQEEITATDYAAWEKRHAPLVGKCFEGRNSYDSENETWPMYAKVIGIADGKLTVFWFEERPQGVIEIQPTDTRYSLLGYWRITEAEFCTAWSNMTRKIARFNILRP